MRPLFHSLTETHSHLFYCGGNIVNGHKCHGGTDVLFYNGWDKCIILSIGGTNVIVALMSVALISVGQMAVVLMTVGQMALALMTVGQKLHHHSSH